MTLELTRNVMYWGPCDTYEEAIEHLRSHRGAVAVDTETIALKGDKSVVMEDWSENAEGELVINSRKEFIDARTCIGFGIAISETEGFYFPLGRPGWKNVPMCDPYPGVQVLENEAITKVVFNSMFDLDRFDETFGIEIRNFEDVAIAAQVQGLWNSLDQNSTQLLGEEHMVIDDVLPKGKTMLDVPFRTTAMKCIADCVTTLKLYKLFQLERWGSEKSFTWQDHLSRTFDVSLRIMECYQVDKQLVPLLRKMSKRGFKINPERVRYWGGKLQEEIRHYDDYFGQFGVNAQSNDQVGKLLLARGNYVPKTPKGHMKVSEEVLHEMRDPVGYMALSRRRRQKLYGTYVKPFGVWDRYGRLLDVPDRAYTHFRLDLATGRLGSWGFNSQNLPPQMRSMFSPDNGVYSWADLHQAEMRVWAAQAQDAVMLKEFAEGRSPHDATLKSLFPGKPKYIYTGNKVLDRHGNLIDERFSSDYYVSSKAFNFAMLADASANILARATRKTVEECQKYKDILYEMYWKSKEHQDYMRQRHTHVFYPDYVEDDFGRRCHVPDLGVFVNETHQEKCRLNYPFQASVASVVKRQMLALDVLGFELAGQVHDEHLVDGAKEFPSWLSEMHPSVDMPFEVDWGETWI